TGLILSTIFIPSKFDLVEFNISSSSLKPSPEFNNSS
ncbi:unnamed protein product, partial [Rotaria magnacalcarata]